MKPETEEGSSRQSTSGSVFRKDIQALRALAVVAVLVFHVRPGWLPGGFVGVDVFFVISGFLITAHLIGEHERNGTIRIMRFYSRRVRRLLPASLVVLIFSMVATVLIIPESTRSQGFREIIASTLYAQNWVLAADSVDYLRSSSAPSLVQHFWTLSVEEQFYIVWPGLLILVGLAIQRRPAIRTSVWIGVTFVVFAVSFPLSIWLTEVAPAAAYFVTPTRMHEFAIGAFVAANSKAITRWASRSEIARGVAVWGGFSAIAFSCLAFTSDTPFPGYLVLVPALGAALVIAAGGPPTRWTPMVLGRARPIQYLGDISYSVYLWHWPLVVLYPIAFGHNPGWAGGTLLVMLTIAISAVSRKFIERPFINAGDSRLRDGAVITSIAVGMVLVVLFSAGKLTEIQQQRDVAAKALAAGESDSCFGAKALDHLESCNSPWQSTGDFNTTFAATDYADTTLDNCINGRLVGAIGDARECSYGKESSDKVVAVVGDSHAGHWLPALQEIGKDRGWRIVTLVRSSCPFTEVTPTIDGVFQSGCETWKDAVSNRIVKSPPDLVVVVSLTPFGYAFGGGELGSEADIESGFVSKLTRFVEASVPVVVIRDTPYMEIDLPTCLSTATESGECDRLRADVLDAHFDPLWNAAPAASAQRVDLSDYFCTETVCASVIGGVVVYRDRQHISATYSRSLADALLNKMQAAGVAVP